MSRIRVLVIDDAVVVRKLVTDALAADPEIEVIGTAANGRLGLAKIAQLKPDAVTLDMEMPEMDGLETLREIRKRSAQLPVIMFSTLTSRGAAVTLDALSAGASDYVTKPANVGGVTEALKRVRDDLIPKIKALCGRASGPSPSVLLKLSAPPSSQPNPPLAPVTKPLAWAAARPTTPAVRPQPATPAGRVELVVVASSTGGPNALNTLLADLGANFPVPLLIVQHMPPLFTKLLAERLTAKTSVRMAEGVDGGRLEPGAGWIAPGNYHMTLDRAATAPCVRLNQEASENGCRPAADVLFRSVAPMGAGVLAVVLTGMGQDGFRGCEAIAATGGRVLAQDEATSVVWGMPGFVARAGLADLVLPLSQLGGEVLRRVRIGRVAAASAGRLS